MRIKGPLFSLSASGVYEDLIEFRSGADGTTAAKRRKAPATRSPAQIAQSAAFAEAVTAWRTLDAPSKQQWRTSAQNTGMSGYQLFISEYQTQNIQAPALPVPP